jgi:hypothetical protein
VFVTKLIRPSSLVLRGRPAVIRFFSDNISITVRRY